MPRPFRLLPLLAVSLLAACGSSPPPPQTAAASGATDLRDTIQKPINKAKGVEDIIQKSHDNRDSQLQDAEGGSASPASPP
ncbi:MAG TPA: hypothetical protein VGH80_15220 [Xanthomonadaceae bacterium]|jgi:hypothetical protein